MANENKQLIYAKTSLAGYFFDAIIDTQHTHTAKITKHPVQTGANVTDHIYMEPVSVAMTIKMSDVMSSISPGQFGDNKSRSVSAYGVLRDLQQLRIPFTVVTRLERYENMVIELLSVDEDYKTMYGLQARVTLSQILVVNVKTVKLTERANVTDSTSLGVVNAKTSSGTINDPERSFTGHSGKF